MKINGIHMHTGSDILDIDVFLHAAEILFDTAKHFKNLEFLDFGSGFKVPINKMISRPISKSWAKNYPKDSLIFVRNTDKTYN